MSPKHTVGERIKGSAAPPNYHVNPPEALPLDQQQDARGPPGALPFERPWDRPTLAEYMGVTTSGLDKLVKEGRAPPFFRAGRMLRWRPAVVRAWTITQEQRAAAESIKAVEASRQRR